MKPPLPMLLACAALLMPAPARAGTIYVDCDNTTAPWDGTQANPYQFIRDGLNNADPADTVQVADGTYTGALNKNLDFGGKAITLRSENGPGVTIIDCGNDGRGFDFHLDEGPDSVLDGFTITNGSAPFAGGAISCIESSPTITNCTLTGNAADNAGGIYCESSNAVIADCTVSDNTAGLFGGGIYCVIGNPTIFNCTITGNVAPIDGGGLVFDTTTATVANCTVSANDAGQGDGVVCYLGSNPIITNCILWANLGEALYADAASTPVVTYSCVQDDDPDDGIIYPGAGNIDDDPLFVTGPSGDYYLSQTAAGQLADSPCVDTGSDIAANLGLDTRTTRTDHLADAGTVDMGYHSPRCPGGLPGDVDGNGVVDGLDLTAVLSAWETVPGDPLWNANADLDCNGVIDGLDLTAVISNWTPAAPAATPEELPLRWATANERGVGAGSVRRGCGTVRRR